VHAALNDTEQSRRVVAMGILGALRPAQRQLHGNAGHIFIRRVRRALVKNHDHVGAQVTLYLHRLFRPHEHLGAIYRRSKSHALFLDLAHGAQAEHLETTRVSQDRTLPFHEVVQVAVLLDHFSARTQPQVKGVAQNHLRAGIDDIARQHALDRAVSTDRHECRGFDHATGEGQTTATSLAISGK